MTAPVRTGRQGAHVEAGGRRLLNFASNDYLGLADDPRLRAAAIAAIERFGAGSGAARALSGSTEEHLALEAELAAFKGTDAAILFNSGFAANSGAIPALAGRGDTVFSDALNHGSIVDGCRLSGARIVVYRHGDIADLAARLAAERGGSTRLIVTDSVFSMDGDIARLDRIAALAAAHGALVLADEAHGGGVYGAHGRGVAEHQRAEAGIALKLGTLGKAMGSIGGYVAGPAVLVDRLRGAARSYLLTTALPPAAVAAARAGLAAMIAEPERRQRLWANAARLGDALRAAGLDLAGATGPILPVLVGDAKHARAAAATLLDGGILVSAVTAPLVAADAARLRLIVGSGHTADDLDRAAAAIATAVRTSC